MSNEDRNWGGARMPAPGKRSGPPRVNRKVSERAALQIRLLAWTHYGRPASAEEEDALLDDLVARATQGIGERRTIDGRDVIAVTLGTGEVLTMPIEVL